MINHTLVKRAYSLGFMRAAVWAGREDLISDVGSPAYLKDRVADTEVILQYLETDDALCALKSSMGAFEAAEKTIPPDEDSIFWPNSYAAGRN